MPDLRKQIRDQQTPLERLRDRLPGFRTYYDREARREADRALRRFGGVQLENVARVIQDVIKRTPLAKLTPYQELLKQAETVRNEIRHGDQGYSGFFQNIKSDSEAALDALYAEDEEIVAALVELAGDVADGTFEPAEVQVELRGLQQRLGDRRNRILALARK